MEMESDSTVSSTTLHGTQFPYTTKQCWTPPPPPQPVSSQGKSLLMSAQGVEPRRVELMHLCIFSLEKRRGHDSIFKAAVDLT